MSFLPSHWVNWKWSLPGLVLFALFAAFANPPEYAVTSPADFEHMADLREKPVNADFVAKEFLKSIYGPGSFPPRFLIDGAAKNSLPWLKIRR